MQKCLLFLRKTEQLHKILCYKYCTIQFNHNYTSDDVLKILTEVNEKGFNELSRYNISKQRILQIESWKRKHGSFNTLEEILELEKFGNKILERFCTSILSSDPNIVEVPNALKKNKQLAKLCIPILYEENRKSIYSCISVHVGINSITWTKLQLDSYNPIDVIDWGYYELSEKKLHLSDIVSLIIYLNKIIPEANAYVFENLPPIQSGAPGSPAIVNINIQKTQITAMISLMLANRKSNDIELKSLSKNDCLNKEKLNFNYNLFYIRQYLASRLYRTLVGNERVSTENVILNLLEKNTDKNANGITQINMPKYLKDMYNTSESIKREYLGQSLLIGLCFLRLCVIKCPISLSLINNTK